MRYRKMRMTTTVLVLLGLLVPAVAVAAEENAEQTVEVSVLPADTLAINVEEQIGLGSVVPGTSTGEVGFWMGITNTTSGGWEVTVDGPDLESFTYDCDEENNCTRVPTDPVETITKDNLTLSGGDQDNWGDDDAVVSFSGSLGGSPLTLLQGTATANGSFGIDNPQPTIELSVPGDAAIGDYYTTLTYTIMAPTP